MRVLETELDTVVDMVLEAVVETELEAVVVIDEVSELVAVGLTELVAVELTVLVAVEVIVDDWVKLPDVVALDDAELQNVITMGAGWHKRSRCNVNIGRIMRENRQCARVGLRVE